MKGNILNALESNKRMNPSKIVWEQKPSLKLAGMMALSQLNLEIGNTSAGSPTFNGDISIYGQLGTSLVQFGLLRRIFLSILAKVS
jgi:hypothetical protein